MFWEIHKINHIIYSSLCDARIVVKIWFSLNLLICDIFIRETRTFPVHILKSCVWCRLDERARSFALFVWYLDTKRVADQPNGYIEVWFSPTIPCARVYWSRNAARRRWVSVFVESICIWVRWWCEYMCRVVWVKPHAQQSTNKREITHTYICEASLWVCMWV